MDDSKASFVTGHILNVDGGFAATGCRGGISAGPGLSCLEMTELSDKSL